MIRRTSSPALEVGVGPPVPALSPGLPEPAGDAVASALVPAPESSGPDGSALGSPLGATLGPTDGAVLASAEGAAVGTALAPGEAELAGGTTAVVKLAQRYSRSVSPEAWIVAARSRPTYRKCHDS